MGNNNGLLIVIGIAVVGLIAWKSGMLDKLTGGASASKDVSVPPATPPPTIVQGTPVAPTLQDFSHTQLVNFKNRARDPRIKDKAIRDLMTQMHWSRKQAEQFYNKLQRQVNSVL